MIFSLFVLFLDDVYVSQERYIIPHIEDGYADGQLFSHFGSGEHCTHLSFPKNQSKENNPPKYPLLLLEEGSSIAKYELVGLFQNGGALYDLISATNRTDNFPVLKDPVCLKKYLTAAEDHDEDDECPRKKLFEDENELISTVASTSVLTSMTIYFFYTFFV
jgi:hypothetical protein